MATLVCFPYAGGNAVNFQRLARELSRCDIEVYAAELPGHDLARADETLADVADVARRAHREITALAAGPILVWGHCAGAAYALELARLLEADGRPPARVFLGALLLDDPARLRREMDQVSAFSNREITARLHEDSAYIELDLLKSERAELVGRAFRHDVCSTNRYFLQLHRQPADARLRTPVDVLVADDDPTTDEAARRYRDWELVADTVALQVLGEGGHYFVRSRPAEVADRIAAACPAQPAGRPA